MQIWITEDWDKEERLKKAEKSSGVILKYDDEDDTLDKECVASASKAGSVSIEAALDMVEQAIDCFYDRVKESASHGWAKSLEDIVREVKDEFSYVKKEAASTSNVQFVSYEHKGSLCRGVLTLVIDGETVTFGQHGPKPAQYPEFWESGGDIFDFDDDGVETKVNVTEGPWIIHKDELPPQYQKYANEIAAVFNENVEHGCCGACV